MTILYYLSSDIVKCYTIDCQLVIIRENYLMVILQFIQFYILPLLF
jgi:hypothetical protein